MKKDTSYLIKRAERFQVILIGEGILVGLVGGAVVLLYRLALSYAPKFMNMGIAFAKESPVKTVLYFLGLILMAVIVGLLVKYEPLISGSGIPQLEGEMAGELNQTWWKVVPAKFIGGFLSLAAGLSLGREGPSIQLGAMMGKGVSKCLKRGRTEEKFLLTCGASAGLSAAFHAPLAGVMFSLEEIHKNFSVSVLISVMASSITADYISSQVFGLNPVFQFDIGNVLPQSYYWMIVVLGILLGILGAFYNWFTLLVQSLYKRASKLNEITKVLIPFLLAGVLGLTAPEFLGSGHELIDRLTSHEFLLGTVFLLLLGKFLFSAISFGSGAPGGIFFPLLVLGALIGGAYGMIGVTYFGLDPDYINNFVLLAMAGYFTAIVRAPITGIILIFEMTGSLSQMLSLSVISIVAYVVANLLKSEPIYESLLERLLTGRGQQNVHYTKQKVLEEFVICHGSAIADRRVSEVEWPKDCLVVAVKRGEKEILPKGDTTLRPSDTVVIMAGEAEMAKAHGKLTQLCMEHGEILS